MLYASGAASQETVLDVAIARGKALSLTEPLGATMAALSCGVFEAERLIKEIHQSHSVDILEVACHNSREAVTVAGHAKAVAVHAHLDWENFLPEYHVYLKFFVTNSTTHTRFGLFSVSFFLQVFSCFTGASMHRMRYWRGSCQMESR
ncbi:hypothetical protein K474DRAFT_877751 [Panus rudis PR-1116 ss-1]|nr:hypothetical protein K474DRAFT_877751 [Panus rudis PR-1116 ss-1]